MQSYHRMQRAMKLGMLTLNAAVSRAQEPQRRRSGASVLIVKGALYEHSVTGRIRNDLSLCEWISHMPP